MLSNFRQGLPEVLYLLGVFFIPPNQNQKTKKKKISDHVINMPVNFGNELPF